MDDINLLRSDAGTRMLRFSHSIIHSVPRMTSNSSKAHAGNTKSWRRRRLFFAAVVCLLAASYAGRERLFVAAARALTVEDPIAPADYLVVLGGSPEDRPFAAAELYRQRFAPNVVVFEYRPGSGGAPSQTELYERVLMLEGVPAGAIERAPGLAQTSWDEAQSLRRFLGARSASRVIIVTSAEHTRRARWAFRQALAGIDVDVRIAAARHDTFDEDDWWRTDEGVLLYVHEFLKFPFYLIRYAWGRVG